MTRPTRRAVSRRTAHFTSLISAGLVLSLPLAALAEEATDYSGKTREDQSSATVSAREAWQSYNQAGKSSKEGRPSAKSSINRSTISTKWSKIDDVSNVDCSTSSAGTASCLPSAGTCERTTGASTQISFIGGRPVYVRSTEGNNPTDGTTVQGTQINLETNESVDLGFDCLTPSLAGEDSRETRVTVSRAEFAEMPVKALEAHAGPAEGWLPVNMVNVLYTESGPQELSVELLDTPVAIRATPVSYHWDLGDGNTITTSNPGKPYPSETISATYTQEGWYDITLTTTFSGQFSVAGGEWQDIDGTIEVSSDPVPVYSKSLESRLVNGDVPVDEDEDPWIPARTADTEGPSDPHATHRTI